MPSTHIFRVRVVLQLTRPARLHAHPSAALYALLAAAYGTARGSDPVVPDGTLLDAPEVCRRYVAPGQRYAFGMTILAATPHEATTRLDTVLEGLRDLGRRAAGDKLALGGNFTLGPVEDLVAGAVRQNFRPLIPIPAEHLAGELARAQPLSELTLRFESPLRTHRSKYDLVDGHAFFDRQNFSARLFVERVVARLRQLGFDSPELDGAASIPQVLENRLVWLDVTYGPKTERKGLGGALGVVRLGRCGPRESMALALGQYVRAGEATRFGFGRYRIAELGPNPYPCRRAVGLIELACDSPLLDEAAAEWNIESGALRHAARAMCNRSYHPQPCTRVEIESRPGKRRVLSIPSRTDRALQRALLAIVAPSLDLFFEESSMAYRQGLGRQRAAARIREAYRQGFRWAVRADFADFFDTIDHRELEDRLQAYVSDDPLVELLMLWVRAGAPAPDHGIPTGAPLSPLLANLFLDQFDEHVAAAQGRLVRYADDFLILFREHRQAREMFELAGEAAAALQLELNQTKTQLVELDAGFDFLGFRFDHQEQWEISPRGEPQLLDDIGWREASRPRTAAAPFRLPGESTAALAPPQPVVIWGPGVASLNHQGNQILCSFDDQRPMARVAADRIEALIVLGQPHMTAVALEKLTSRGVPVYLADDSGRVLAALSGEQPLEDPAAVAGQFRAQSEISWRLEIARGLVAAKLHNYAALADDCLGRRYDRVTGRTLRELAAEARRSASVEQLLGLEGAGAARWYGAFSERLSPQFTFTHRVAPHAADPVNVLLNIAQTSLHRQLILMIRQAGLIPSLGILHKTHPGHAALASDLQEPFRHLIILRREVGPHLAVSDAFHLFPIDERGNRKRLSWQRPFDEHEPVRLL